MQCKRSWFDIIFNLQIGTNQKVCTAVRKQIWHHWGVSWICTSMGDDWAVSIKIKYTHAFFLTKPTSGTNATHTLAQSHKNVLTEISIAASWQQKLGHSLSGLIKSIMTQTYNKSSTGIVSLWPLNKIFLLISKSVGLWFLHMGAPKWF